MSPVHSHECAEAHQVALGAEAESYQNVLFVTGGTSSVWEITNANQHEYNRRLRTEHGLLQRHKQLHIDIGASIVPSVSIVLIPFTFPRSMANHAPFVCSTKA